MKYGLKNLLQPSYNGTRLCHPWIHSIIAFLFLLTGQAWAETVIVDDQSIDGLSVSGRLLLWEDKEGALSVEHVAAFDDSAFFKPKTEVPNFSYTKSVIWAKLNFDNRTEKSKDLILEYSYPLADYVDLYVLKESGHWQVLQSGDRLPPSARSIRYRFPAFALALPAGSTSVLLRIRTGGLFLIPVKLWTPKEFNDWRMHEAGFIVFFVGILASMIFYNLLNYLGTRASILLIYVAFLFAILSAQLGGNTGLTHLARWDAFAIFSTNDGFLLSTSATAFFACLLCFKFLNITRKNRFSFWTLSFCMALSVINFVLSIFSYNVAVKPAAFGITLASLSILISSIQKSLEGYRPAYFFTVAWLASTLSMLIQSLAYLAVIPMTSLILFSTLFGASCEVVLISLGIGDKIKKEIEEAHKQKEEERKKKEHYFQQMEKVFYPHQLQMMKDGKNLEETMPIGKLEACVIAFDIVNSSKIGHAEQHSFFEDIMKQCQLLMNSDYNLSTLTANAFRIKELGDGFLCSIGFPFKISGSASLEQSAYRLALGFIDIFQTQVLQHFGHNHYYCGIGIAKGEVEGYFPKSGIKEYDLFGDGIIHATRYESMRKSLMQGQSNANIIILQEAVYQGLDPIERNDLIVYDLLQAGMKVRDDPNATKLYYRLIHSNPEDSRELESSGKIQRHA